jgi:hypothetical protein
VSGRSGSPESVFAEWLDVEPWTDAVARVTGGASAPIACATRARGASSRTAPTTLVVDLSERRKAAALDSTQSVQAQ